MEYRFASCTYGLPSRRSDRVDLCRSKAGVILRSAGTEVPGGGKHEEKLDTQDVNGWACERVSFWGCGAGIR